MSSTFTPELLATIRRWARRRFRTCLRGRIDVDDLVQDTLLRALEKGVDSQHVQSKQGYLFRILQNRIRDEIRSAQTVAARMPGADGRRYEPVSAHALVESRELLGVYRRSLRRIPHRMRRAFVMRVELGYSYGKVARLLGCRTVDAARMTVNRARRLILERLEHDDVGRPQRSRRRSGPHAKRG